MHNPFQARPVQVSILTLVSVLIAGGAIGFLKARFIPELLDVNPWVWVTVAILFLIRPVTRFFGK